MQANKVSKIVIYVLSILILGYVLYISVYNQIISQSDGFFNMIIFAGILLLVFILISLIVKLMAYTPTNDISPALKYAVLLGAVCLIILSVFLRINYSSSVPAEESIIYQTCEYISDGNLADATDVTDELLYVPGNFAYSFLVSIIFKIFDVNSDYIIFLNIAFLIIIAVFAYLLVSLLTDNICGMLAFIIALFIPGNTFAVYTYGYELYYAANFMIVAYLFAVLFIKTFDKIYIPIILGVVAGIFSGILMFCEPISVIFIIAYILWVIFKNRSNIIPAIIVPVLMLILFFVFTSIKSSMLEYDFSEVLGATFKSINPFYDDINMEEYTFGEVFRNFGNYIDDLNSHIVDNYYFLTSKSGSTYSSLQAIWLQLGNQLIFMFMIIMSVANILYLLKSSLDRVTPFFSIFIVSFIVQFCGSKYSKNGLYFGMLLIVLATTTIQNMFVNHHPDLEALFTSGDSGSEQADENNAEYSFEDMEARLSRSRVIAFYGENDLLFEQIKREEKENQMNADIAATKISTGFDEEGQYVSQVETVEYFDEVDEPVEVKHVADVKAIPGTRPVEVVKPISADEPLYFDKDDSVPEKKIPAFRVEKPALNKPVVAPVITPVVNLESDNEKLYTENTSDMDYFDEEDTNIAANNADATSDAATDNNPFENSDKSTESSNEAPVAGEFVFRKRDKRENESTGDIKTNRRKSRISLDNTFTDNEKTDKKVDKKADIKADKAKAEKNKTEKTKAEKPKKSGLFGRKNKIENNEVNESVEDSNYGEKAKKGEPLHNPLPLPKPHVSKDFDFDIEITDNDDFDV